MANVLLWLHFTLLLLGYCLLALGYFHAGLSFTLAILMVRTIRVVAVLGFVVGLALMAARRGKSESICLALTTVAFFVLLVLVIV